MEARLIERDELQATIDLTAVAFGAGPRASEDYRKQSAELRARPHVRGRRRRRARGHRGHVLAGALALPGGGSVPLA
jgi:hypothetical protein